MTLSPRCRACDGFPCRPKRHETSDHGKYAPDDNKSPPLKLEAENDGNEPHANESRDLQCKTNPTCQDNGQS